MLECLSKPIWLVFIIKSTLDKYTLFVSAISNGIHPYFSVTPAIGAKGSMRPGVSGVTGVVMSTSEVKFGSEKIAVLNEIGLSSLTSTWNCVCAAFWEVDAVSAGCSSFPVPMSQYAPAATARVTMMSVTGFDFIDSKKTT